MSLDRWRLYLNIWLNFKSSFENSSFFLFCRQLEKITGHSAWKKLMQISRSAHIQNRWLWDELRPLKSAGKWTIIRTP